MRANANDLAVLLDGRIVGDGSVLIVGAEVDSRRVRAGDLFVALEGDRQDGHGFVQQALETAAAALVRFDFECAPLADGKALIQVNDPLSAYHELARHERSRRSWSIAAITGSVGKTTTKDFLAHLLAARFKVGASEGNRNSALGLPAQLLRQESGVEVFVAEAGMSSPGELSILGRILRPDVLLYTRIAAVHTEFFPSIEGIVQAKAELLPFVEDDGFLVVNAADPNQSAFQAGSARVLRYGSTGADVWIENLESRGLLGSRFDMVTQNKRVRVELPVAGAHQAENFLAAATAAVALSIPLEEVASRADGLSAAPHRGRIETIRNNVMLVDDSYNSSPVAVSRLLDLLASTPGRRVAVLGEMYELGQRSRAAHIEVGRRAANVCHLLIAVGEAEAAALAEAAVNEGLPRDAVMHVTDASTAADTLEPLLRPGDVVLIKGSRGVGLDRTVAKLMDTEAA
jgi:UDP-N-acetylmuramoyl-tripeptide--D-alanyl-D-alanine ligase